MNSPVKSVSCMPPYLNSISPPTKRSTSCIICAATGRFRLIYRKGWHVNEAMYISADGSISTSQIKPSLAEAQEFVGGYIQMCVPQGDRECQMLMDEDAKMKGSPVNLQGTQLYQHEAIRGNIILLRGNCRWID